MAQSVMQFSFGAGEWAPALNARVDMAKYKTAAALAKNYFVDYRGGLSSRTGTKYVTQCLDSTAAVRLIPFQASQEVAYALEFGNLYLRFINEGAPVLEAGLNITAITNANPAVVSVVNPWAVGDWVFISGVGGMTQVNGQYYKITARTPATVTLAYLNGDPVDATAFGVYTAGGTIQRVLSYTSPYAAADLALLKFVQNVDQLIICHPNYRPYVLTLVTATNWTLNPIVFGTAISPPTGLVINSTLAAGVVAYSYVVCAVDQSGQESAPSAAALLVSRVDFRVTPGSNLLSWNVVAGALSYNVYRAVLSYGFFFPVGTAYGYIGNVAANSFIDTNVEADFSITPPVPQNPFLGTGVVSYTVTTNGTYTSVPTVSVAPPSGGSVVSATAVAVLGVGPTPTIAAGGAGYAIGDTIALGNGVIVQVATVAAGAILTFEPMTDPQTNRGAIAVGNTPANPVAQVSTSGGGAGATVNLVWGVSQVNPVSFGAGYTTPPAVTFSTGIAAATAVLGASSAANPSVPGFLNQRLVLAALAEAPQTFYMSRPGGYYNFDVSNPIQADDAIVGTIVSGQINEIKSLVPMPTGLVALTDRIAWLIGSGSGQEGISPLNATANPQSYVGASDVPPIVANDHILFVQAKGSVVRDIVYNFGNNIYSGMDISVLSSHLFYGYQVLEWAYAEEPFKLIYCIRNDGSLLILTYVKEQELIGWTWGNTTGLFKSVCSITEEVSFGKVDATYVVVDRAVGGGTVKYIERFTERQYPRGRIDSWSVDSGLRYDGAPATTFSGGRHLAGLTVTGTADGAVIPPFVMPANGSFTLAAPASVVTVGLAFVPDFETLNVDLGEPTVQGKRKKVSAVNVRVQDTLGLEIGTTFNDLVVMDDLVMGNLGSQTNQIVTDLVTGDARQVLDPDWNVGGRYAIRQTKPYPVSILGVMPEITVGDDAT